ncbi:hypothetical protein GGF32_001821 [Allomyces javanicus]|nr:hypothetical protein GGF32_001821 [Allomyces javanicus]
MPQQPLPAPNPNLHQVVIIGRTGEGKSTLINSLLNYFRKASFDKPVLAIKTQFCQQVDPKYQHIVSSESDPSNQAKSQTSWPVVYDIGDLQILDTPGFADCNGTETDKANLEMIQKAMASRGHITAVVLVMNGSLNRQTTQDAYVLESVRSLLPDKILENLILVFTRCESTLHCRYPLKEFCQQVCKPKRVLFMDNVVLGSDPATWENDPAVRKKAEAKWKQSMMAMRILTGFLRDMPNIPAKLCVELQEVRSRGMACINDLMTSIRNLGMVKRQLQMIAICKVCPIQEDGTKNPHATKDGCGAKIHLHRRGYLFKAPVTVSDTLKQLKIRAEGLQQTAMSTKAAAEADLKAVEKAINDKHKAIAAAFHKIKELCSGYNPVGELSATIAMLQQEAALMTNMDERRDADDNIQRLTDLMKELEKIVPKRQLTGESFDLRNLDVHFAPLEEAILSENDLANVVGGGWEDDGGAPPDSSRASEAFEPTPWASTTSFRGTPTRPHAPGQAG